MLEITPEDVVIIKTNDYLDDFRENAIKGCFKEFFGVEKIIFLEGGADFEVAKPTDPFIQKVKKAINDK